MNPFRVLSWILTTVLALSCAVLSADCVGQPAETPMQTVQHLLSLPHGLLKLAPQDKERLERVLRDPAPHVSALRKVLDGGDLLAPGDSEAALRVERAIRLLGTIGSTEALDDLGRLYMAADSALADPKREQSRNRALELRRILLDALGPARQGVVLQQVLGTLDRMDYASRLAALQYLRRSSVGDAAVIDRLRKYLEDPNSPLYQDKDAARTLEAITRQR